LDTPPTSGPSPFLKRKQSMDFDFPMSLPYRRPDDEATKRPVDEMDFFSGEKKARAAADTSIDLKASSSGLTIKKEDLTINVSSQS